MRRPIARFLALSLFLHLNPGHPKIGLGQDALDTPALATAIAGLSPHVAPQADRERLRTQLSRAAREKILAANRASTDAWNNISSKADWEAFRLEKLAALRRALGTLPPRPPKPRTLVTAELPGDGFKIQNLVYESRPGLLVTANLYVPDPPRESMPGIVISHSHHNPKEQGELQDMGMTWARAGCYVLIPHHLGHGERRQHPFAAAADFSRPFQVGRQDYYFRYDTSLQIYLGGETLIGWLAHDLMTGIDLLLAQAAIDRERIILLGAVAGGGDPAGVTAALDDRITCVVPFNFGGPQPETRYPLPDDAETSFNYAGGGSWESTRNLYRSAADGFLPWTIVGSVAPRHLIHAHEFAWDQQRDPVWRRYQKIWSFYGAKEKLSFAHGHGTLSSADPPGSHCNNIGAAHRRQIHEALSRWFGIQVQPDQEYSNRKSREQLLCLTDQAARTFEPKPLHEILAQQADEQLAAVAEKLASLSPSDRRQFLRQRWSAVLGDVDPPRELTVRNGAPHREQIQSVQVLRELLQTESGITIAMLTLAREVPSPKGKDQTPAQKRVPVLAIASDGIAGALARRSDEIAAGVAAGAVVALVEVRGAGFMGPGNDHGQQSAHTSLAATELMCGQTLLGGQLRDLRAAWQHLRKRPDIAPQELIVVGGSGVTPIRAADAFSFPRRIDGRPPECQPTAALLALLLALYEDDVSLVAARHGIVSYRSLLDSQFVQTPLDAVPPGVFTTGDCPLLAASLGASTVLLEDLLDGTGSPVPLPATQQFYAKIFRQLGEQPGRIEIAASSPAQDSPPPSESSGPLRKLPGWLKIAP